MMVKLFGLAILMGAGFLYPQASKADDMNSFFMGAHWEDSNLYNAQEQNFSYLRKYRTTFFSPKLRSIKFISHQRRFPGDSDKFNDYGLRGNFYLLKKQKHELYFGASSFLENYFSEKLGTHVNYNYKWTPNLIIGLDNEWKSYEDSRRNVLMIKPGAAYYYRTWDFSARLYNVFNEIEDFLFAHMYTVGKTYRNFRVSYSLALGEEINDLAIIDEFVSHTLTFRYRGFNLFGTYHRGSKRDSELIGLYYAHSF